MADNDMIMIKDVRVSFPHLFTRPTINGEEGKCGATLMFDNKRHKKTIARLETAITDLSKLKFKGRKLPSDKLCLRDGEDKGRAEYEGYQVLTAGHRSKPLVVAKDGATIITDEEDSPIYAGCYVNAKIRLWAQDNTYGKRINAELIAIQFVRDGDPLDGSYVSVEDAASGFDAVEEDDEDDFLAT